MADGYIQGTNKRSQHQLELEIENMGGHLNAYTSVRIMPFNFIAVMCSDNSNFVIARKYCLLCEVPQCRCT